MTDPTTELKRQAGTPAAEYVESAMIVGLGHGSTAIHALRRISEHCWGYPEGFHFLTELGVW